MYNIHAKILARPIASLLRSKLSLVLLSALCLGSSSLLAQDTVPVYIYNALQGGNGTSHVNKYNRAPTTNMLALYPELTSNYEVWQAFLNSSYLIGRGSSKVRGWDVVEDGHINFIRPDVSNLNYWWVLTNTSDSTISRDTYPLVFRNGEAAGQSVIGNDNILAIGDDNYLYLNSDGTFSLYDYPGASLQQKYTWTSFSGGIWQGQLFTDKLQYLIGMEENILYFLEGDNTVTRYGIGGAVSEHYEYNFGGELAGHSLGDIIDGKDSEYTFLGIDNGQFVIVGVGAIPEPSTALLGLTASSALLLRRRRRTI